MAKNQQQQAKAKAQQMLAAGKPQERVAAQTGFTPQRVERMATRTEGGAPKREQAAPSNALTQYGVDGNFGGGAFNAARSAGLSVEDIERLAPTSGLKIGEGVKWILENEQNFPSYAAGAGSTLAGQDVRSQAYFAPNAAWGRFGPNENIVLAASPEPKPYAETLKFLNERFWNPSEAEKQKYYANYQDDLSGGIMPTQKTYTPEYGKYKAADMPMTKGQDWYHPSRMAGSNLSSALPAQQAGQPSAAQKASEKGKATTTQKTASKAKAAAKLQSAVGTFAKKVAQQPRSQTSRKLLETYMQAFGAQSKSKDESDFFLPGSFRYGSFFK